MGQKNKTAFTSYSQVPCCPPQFKDTLHFFFESLVQTAKLVSHKPWGLSALELNSSQTDLCCRLGGNAIYSLSQPLSPHQAAEDSGKTQIGAETEPQGLEKGIQCQHREGWPFHKITGNNHSSWEFSFILGCVLHRLLLCWGSCAGSKGPSQPVHEWFSVLHFQGGHSWLASHLRHGWWWSAEWHFSSCSTFVLYQICLEGRKHPSI